MSVLKSSDHTGNSRRLPRRTARTTAPSVAETAHASVLQVAAVARHERFDGVPLRFIRFAGVRDRTGLSRSTIWRLERRGVFPKHRRLSANAVGWLEAEIDDWVRSRVANG